jgi:flagellar hook-associated protein 3 FlgL
MRTTTMNSWAAAVANLQRRQTEMNDAQERLTSGLRVMRASDDPTAAARAERARALMQRAESTGRAVDASQNAMTLTESALADAGELLQQARELVVAAGNASYTEAERQDVANQLAEIRKQLMGVANRSNGAGGYVFSGQGSAVPPFLDRAGGVTYEGSGGTVRVASEEPLPLTLNGGEVWMSAPTGNGQFETQVRSPNSGGAWIDAGRVTDPSALTGAGYAITFSVSGGVTTYSVTRDDGVTTDADGNPLPSGAAFTAGQAIELDGMAVIVSGAPADGDTFGMVDSEPTLDVFGVLDDLVAQLSDPALTSAQVSQTVQMGLRDLDRLTDHLQGARSMTGEVLNRIEGIQGRLDDMKLYGENTRSDAEDLDMIQAISDFENKQTGYQAALATYSTVQRMSLFDYIKT